MFLDIYASKIYLYQWCFISDVFSGSKSPRFLSLKHSNIDTTASEKFYPVHQYFPKIHHFQ